MSQERVGPPEVETLPGEPDLFELNEHGTDTERFLDPLVRTGGLGAGLVLPRLASNGVAE